MSLWPNLKYAPPRREEGDGMDELERVKRLSEVKSNTSVKFLSPAVSPGCHCPMRMASLVAKDISGLSSLLVGMPECATHARLFNPNPEGPNGELHWLHVLDLHEVVLGVQDGIISALKKMDKVGAKAILLIVTCIPELLGEDIDGILREALSCCPRDAWAVQKLQQPSRLLENA
jgi:nitrogenase molybdenum-iron protein alpha/beta subunit